VFSWKPKAIYSSETGSRLDLLNLLVLIAYYYFPEEIKLYYVAVNLYKIEHVGLTQI